MHMCMWVVHMSDASLRPPPLILEALRGKSTDIVKKRGSSEERWGGFVCVDVYDSQRSTHQSVPTFFDQLINFSKIKYKFILLFFHFVPTYLH